MTTKPNDTGSDAAAKAAKNTSKDSSAAEPQRPDTIRDTIESVIVALILAFVFRAFVVEAFVIPTGSMAPSLYGLHGQYRCPNCQYTFAYGIREGIPGDRARGGTLKDSFYVRCPNCTYDAHRRPVLNNKEPVVANSGDRILVLKWPYAIGGEWLGPKRWDVVVFKDPQDGETNFIKRLIGLPGEVLEIINGDIYAAPVSALADHPDIIEALSEPPPTDGRERRLTDEQSRTLAGLLRIQRKTAVAQESLWMIHYDHDYMPNPDEPRRRDSDYDPPSWEEIRGRSQTKGAWRTDRPIIQFDPPDNAPYAIELRGKPIHDDCGYNNVNFLNQRQSNVSVGDVRLKFVLLPGQGQGEIALRLTRGEGRETTTFVTRIQSDGNVTLEMIRANSRGVPTILETAQIAPLAAGKARQIEFENLDYRVCLRIDGKEVAHTTDEQYAPDVRRLLEDHRDGRNNQATVSILAQNLPLELRHVQVHRDVFYLSPMLERQSDEFINCPGWGTATNPILLRADPPDYFCCGDNSPQSKDSRLWVDVCRVLRERKNYQMGTVPGDQMIGRAFFVYWPSGLRLSKETPAVIPNVGRMRIIR